jgi:anti-sigma regulatory factor (Ser/Thr protein kinase)
MFLQLCLRPHDQRTRMVLHATTDRPAETGIAETSHSRGWPAAQQPGGRDPGPAESARQAKLAPRRQVPPSRSDQAPSPACGSPPAWEGHGGQARTWPGSQPETSGDGIRAVRPISEPRGQSTADVWPLRSHLELGALPGAVACARLHARQVLWEWGLSAFSDDAELLVSELVTNATEASLSTERILPVRLWLSSDQSRLLIQVHDTNHCPPAPTGGAGDQDERGRGLLIVDAISTKWGWDTEEDNSGKIVWALIE